MLQFIHESLPMRVVFGDGSLSRLRAEIERLGVHRVLVLSTSGKREQAETIADSLGSRAAGVYARAIMHVPVETAEAARAEASRLRADCCVAIGGGSAIGLGKAIALTTALPLVAIPTTYAGSEMTPIYGLTVSGAKRTGRDPRVLPKTVIYDPELTISLPPEISGPSGVNAMAHCVEALYAEDGNPITSMLAEEGLRALAASLPVVVREPADNVARGRALYGAWLAGATLASASVGLHHKLCHVLGGSYNLPHAEVHTIILPHATSYNSTAAAPVMARIASALGVQDAAQGLYDLAQKLDAKMALEDIGMRWQDLDRAADLATQNPYTNPAPVTREGVRELLENAFYGRSPSAAER